MPNKLELGQLLDDFSPSSAEKEALAKMRSLAQDPQDVVSSSRYDPGHFTASAFVTDPAVSRLVLLLHGRVGAWLQPGGHVEQEDPTFSAAALREVHEETGLTDLAFAGPGLFDIDVHRVPAHGDLPSHHHFDLRFHLTTNQLRLRAPEGGDEVRWIPLGEVPTWTMDASVLRSVGKLEVIAASR